MKKLITLCCVLSLVLGMGYSHISFAKAPAKVVKDGWVTYNKSSGKYHNPNCKFAKQCKENCVKIKYSQAVKKKGKPCKVCHGTPM